MNEYVKTELLVLIPVLYAIGEFIKASKINDKFIPLIIGGIGIVLASIYVISADGFSGMTFFSGITQGILCAGCAVYGNQIFKQLGK